MISLVSTVALNLSGFAFHVIVLHPFNGITSCNLWAIYKTLDSLFNSSISVVICKIVQVRAQQEKYVVHEYVE